MSTDLACRQALAPDLGHAANLLFPPPNTAALLPTHPPLLPFIRLFRNISHLSIYPRPILILPSPTRQPLASLLESFSMHNGACSQTVAECKHQTAS